MSIFGAERCLYNEEGSKLALFIELLCETDAGAFHYCLVAAHCPASVRLLTDAFLICLSSLERQDALPVALLMALG